MNPSELKKENIKEYQKKYRNEHREHIKELQKKSIKSRAPDIKKYMSKYYQDRAKTIICDICQSKLKEFNLKKHLLTKKHLSHLNNL